MYKKAGIVVGIALIILAGVIYWTFGNKDEQTAEGETTPSASLVSTEEKPKPKPKPVETTPLEPIEQKEPVTQPVQPVEPVVVTPVEDKPQSVFSEVDAEALGKPIITRQEVMVVSKKKVLILDSEYGKNTGKQLAYTAELLSGDETMSLFLNGVAYESVKIGDKLKVDYNIYKNDKGVEFPVIMNVATVQ